MSARPGLVVVVAMAALLSACGDGSEPTGSSSGDVTAPTTTAPTTSGLDSTPDLAAVDVALTAVATADQPVGLTHRPGDPDDILWVAGQTGTVSRVELSEGAVVEADVRVVKRRCRPQEARKATLRAAMGGTRVILL